LCNRKYIDIKKIETEKRPVYDKNTESGNKRDSFLNDKYRWKWFTRYEDWRRTILIVEKIIEIDWWCNVE